MSERNYILYHANCMDGFAAYAIAECAVEDSCDINDSQVIPICYAVKYNKPMPPIKDDSTVYILDFSYPRAELLALAKRSRHLVVLDHHKSAMEALEGLQEELNAIGCRANIIFDMNKSGAGLTWEYFEGSITMPPVVQLIQQRDLWQKERREEPFSNWADVEAISAYLFSFAFTGRQAEELKDTILTSTPSDMEQMLLAGKIMQRRLENDIDSFLQNGHFRLVYFPVLEGDGKIMPDFVQEVPIVNVPYMYASAIGDRFSKAYPFVAIYWETEEGCEFSLRSNKENPKAEDVSRIAALYGGGGHKHAAGFKRKREEFRHFQPSARKFNIKDL